MNDRAAEGFKKSGHGLQTNRSKSSLRTTRLGDNVTYVAQLAPL